MYGCIDDKPVCLDGSIWLPHFPETFLFIPEVAILHRRAPSFVFPPSGRSYKVQVHLANGNWSPTFSVSQVYPVGAMPFLGLRGTRLLLAISFTAGIGFCLFGIDNAALGGVISSGPCESAALYSSSADVAVDRRFGLDATGQGAITGAYELGCFAGALLVSAFVERWSRRAVLLTSVIPLMVGAALQVSTFSTAQLAVGRVVAGVGMGGITSMLPVWQSETSPPHLRGMLVCCSLSMLIVGQLIAYWAAYGLLQKYDTDMTWRVMFSLQMMAGAVMAVALLFMPVSRRRGVQPDVRNHRGGWWRTIAWTKPDTSCLVWKIAWKRTPGSMGRSTRLSLRSSWNGRALGAGRTCSSGRMMGKGKSGACLR
jgi:MFS family permease